MIINGCEASDGIRIGIENDDGGEWRTTPCRLSAAAYSIYSQLTSIAGGRSSIRNPKTRHAVGTGIPPNMGRRIRKEIKCGKG
jgi:hypothetical protein